MAKTPRPVPTDNELRILACLWEHGPSTVREVHTQSASQRGVGYTTTLKLLQIMLDKGLVIRDESQRSHIYHAAALPAPTRRQLARNLIDAAFAGSAKDLVIEALNARKPTPTELAEVRQLLDKLQEGGG